MSSRGAGLPIRRTLALALVATIVLPVIACIIVAGAQFGANWHAGGDAAGILRSGASHWHDPTWRSATRAHLAAQGIDFTLLENGREIYTTGGDLSSSGGRQRTVQVLTIVTSHPTKVAYIYADAFPWGGFGGAFWLAPLAGLATLLITLAVIAWFLGRTLLKPLAATSDAARRIATGDLEIALPASRLSEITDLSVAFAAMSEALRTSLQQQAGLEEERRLFIGAIAHDLRTPLFSLRGYLEGLEHGLATSPQKQAEYTRICREKADVLERLIADLFDYTKIEYLEQALRRESLDLGALLGTVVDGRRMDAESKDIALSLQGPSQPCRLTGDAHLLGRAVENLLDNALRYTPRGGTIQVEWHVSDQRAIFSVTDSGPGIAAADLSHLFEPLYRGDPSRHRDTGGTGLGLAIARRILRAHAGDLRATSSIGGGAMFTGIIPLGSEATAGEQTGSSVVASL